MFRGLGWIRAVVSDPGRPGIEDVERAAVDDVESRRADCVVAGTGRRRSSGLRRGADERDAIRVRTNVRNEDAYLYRLRMPVPAIRSLFLGYVDEANALATTPRFYNTVTVNCTTLVYHMMKRIVGYLPMDYRILFSGYLPEYVYRVGGLDNRYPFAELRARGHISERARKADRSGAFSADIRQGIADVGAAELPGRS
jgi:hypothetical protein